MTVPIMIVAVAGALLIGGILGYFFRQMQVERDRKNRKERAESILEEAHDQSREIVLKARDEALEIRSNAEGEIARRRNELSREEDRLQGRRADLDRRVEALEKREAALNKRQGIVDRRANEVDKQYEDIMAELERVSNMTIEEARSQLFEEVEKTARRDTSRIIHQIEQEAQMEGEKRAREIIADAIQRVASDHVSDITTSIVALPSDDMKGRIIGRNGRNIRAFEQAVGVDVIVDDTPEAVTVSCFDSVRREVARRALERLVLDGRIHPAYIEKIVQQVQDDVSKEMIEEAEKACFDAGVHGLHPEIIKKLGRLRFRTSYGQNQLAHAVETAQIASVIAAELGANADIARAGGLLHDLGKAMDHDTEGTHAQLGAEFAKRYGVHPEVVNTIAAHHHETEQTSVEAVIVEAADAISGARPGARRESLEQYVKRIRALEEIANSFKGVSESYALQAGREIRVLVKPEDIDDLDATQLARDVAKKIEEGMQYPGQIKVTVIRETRAVDYAK